MEARLLATAEYKQITSLVRCNRGNAVTGVDIPERTKISKPPLCSAKAVVQQ